MTRQSLSLASQVSPPDRLLQPRSSLPSPDTRHWVPRKKAEVVAAVERGVLSREEACKLYKMAVDEFTSWEQTIKTQGVSALQVSGLNERRKHSRRSVGEAAAIIVGGDVIVDCMIVDIGPRGARLEFKSPVAIPRRFLLRCERNRRSIWAHVAWRRDCVLGVEFEMAVISPCTRESGVDAWLLGESPVRRSPLPGNHAGPPAD